MRRYSRYLLTRYLSLLVLSWVVLTGIFLMDQLFLMFNLIITKGVELRHVAETLVYVLPFVMAMSVPLAAMAGAMMTFGKIAQDNEIVALRSAGVRLSSVFTPIFLATLIFSVLMVGFNLYVVPEANHRRREIMGDVASKNPTVRLESGRFNSEFRGYTIYIGDMKEKQNAIYDIMVSEDKPPVPTIITAPSGKLITTPDERYMQMILYDSETHQQIGNSYRRIKSDTQVINLELNTELIRRERSHRNDREKTLAIMLEELDTNRIMLASYTEELEGKGSEDVEKEKIERRIESIKDKNSHLTVEINKAIAMAIAGILFVCFGAALGGKLKRGEIGLAIVLSLIFFAFYYIMIIGLEKYAKSGKVDAGLAMWIPNLVFLPFTVEVFAEVFFERSLLLKRWRR
ncbi:LptF/LptG family permease [candidate division WOR-3 bacterium]|uniref:LptF/LptG family permease n=1 Tax=candidate division WOR-3 bacterium TaxID=2052148 RepID=A0A9D5KA00_UNCW3|nr:LptF/LptG family permease [candidate division WOR-3 bacterium]MBD3364369.1 LptF/LptG family permease [candidate division WOR-3 bacterium]